MIVVHPDGTEIPLEVSGTPVKDKNGNIWASLVSFMDITERKRAESEIKTKNEELLKINAEKDKFFSIIAHDLRSPFNAFLGLTQLLEEELHLLSPDEIKTFAVSMRKSASMLFHLLENLLEWSQMQRGLLSFNPETSILANEIASGIELVRNSADKKMIEIKQDIPGNLLLKADDRMFQSLMRNLLFNAVKFTPKNGEITIEAKRISNKMLQISVSDTGIGMDQDMIDKLFRVDEQLNRKGTEGEPSTGLGLIICKDIVEKHRGRIWVTSEVGKGSTFFLTIPCDTNTMENPGAINISPLDEKLNQVKNLKVLIAEDDEISKMLLSTALRAYSNEILNTQSGIETVEACRNNPDIDLVMMDIHMADLDGYEATRQIRRFNKNVIIIAQTACGIKGDMEKSVQAGCNDHISKPIKPDTLRNMILKHF
jgi:CheY-like chemotaxis protein/nitrogen-specific signal transduction histidine kinase